MSKDNKSGHVTPAGGNVVSDLGFSPKEAGELKIKSLQKISEKQANAIKMFASGELGLGVAAHMAGLSQEAFMETLGALGIASVNYNPEDLTNELDILKKQK